MKDQENKMSSKTKLGLISCCNQIVKQVYSVPQAPAGACSTEEGLLSLSFPVLCRDLLRGEDEGSRLVSAWRAKEACSGRKGSAVLSARSLRLGQSPERGLPGAWSSCQPGQQLSGGPQGPARCQVSALQALNGLGRGVADGDENFLSTPFS